ncbi:synaptopodin-2 isoform X2 [Thalassophryne amazonica]|uniref:synaptopodin-2 isoform X2 n=1 Tax=Thalassophryne amazonica TaxID=390379 RepID=UPI0014725D58|nr:synaptopodin-2 isoform X2 [Thalassophryne amazonica]
MGTGEYVCVTLRGGAPWGFTLREGEGDACRSIQVHQVEDGGRAFLAGVRDGDEVVSVNGEPCADLTLSEASALIDTSKDRLQLLVKRCTSIVSRDFESDGMHFDERESLREPLKSTALHIQSPKHGSQSPSELYISESHDEASYEELESNSEFLKGSKLFDTKQLGVRSRLDPVFQQRDDGVQLSFSPGDMIELQVSLTEQTSENRGCTSLGSARGIEGDLSNREVSEAIPGVTDPQCEACPVREPLGQHGVVLSSPSMLGQVEVILQQQPAASGAGRGIEAVGGSVGSQGEGGGDSEGVPQAFTVTFGVPSEDTTPADEQESDSDGDQDKPNKHRPRHARLRRGESLSEKQVKEAKSKCKRIALLLTAAPPNPNNKGVLMFKKHRQRAKKYTLVSYGTGDDEPEYSDEEDKENDDDDKEEETHTVEFTFLASDDSEIDKHFLANTQSKKGVLTINWDKSLLEIEQQLNNQEEMECLPETKGKGALMFAQRRQRIDEISAEHEELRRQGIPVEGVSEVEKKMMEQSYVQAAPAGHTYMDVNVPQQNQQQYQQYQEQQYCEQQQHYQQQQQYHQQYQQQQYEQQHYQQQQMYQQQQQQQYNQEQQQIPHYSPNMNGHHQTNGMQSSFGDHSVKPFSVQNTLATPYPPAMSGISQEPVGQGEQIASRDERISTPAIKTGILQDTRKRNTGKPMFTFKEAPKVSPNPALLNLLNRKDKKPGFEPAPEEDYLSLGAEACNFLQNPNVKHKVPPPVAPKPMINPSSLPWSSQIEGTNQDMPQCAGNSISTPAVAPTTEATPVTELEPKPAPASEPSHSPEQQPPMSTTAEGQQAWDLREPKPQQQPTEVPVQDEGGQVSSTIQPETDPVTSWGAVQMKTQHELSTSWHPAQVQPLNPPPSPPQQPSWVAHQPSQAQTQPQSTTNTWSPQIQTSWSQGQEQAEAQTHAQVTWSQPQEQTQCQPQVQPSWTHSEQPHLQQTWGQHQEPMQQQPPPQRSQPLQGGSEPQPPWVRQSQQKSQLQPSWVQQGESESQAQPPWVQSQQAWPQTQTLGQSQPSYVSSGHPQEPLVSTWPPSQPQAQQNSWMQAGQSQPPVQPQAPLDSWASAPTQAQSQPTWSQNLQNQGQHLMNPWGQEQIQPQPPWAQSAPPQSTPPPNWQQSTPTTSPQPPVNMWNPTQVQSQTPMNTWVPQSQQTSTNISTAMVNIGATRPSPKPWHPLQDTPQRTPPPPPQRMHSFTIRQRNSSPINPMATVLNPSSPGSAFEMPAVRGKGAEMFAKRQSRMEKFVVDSETVQANKATRSTSPAASLPNEWKYTPNALGSLSAPARFLGTGQQFASSSSSPKPAAQASTAQPTWQTSWVEKGRKPLTPWEAASRHPLGLVDEAFALQDLQQSLASNVHLAAQRKIQPGSAAEWKTKVCYKAPQKTGSQTWSQGQSYKQSRAQIPLFVSPTKSVVSTSATHAGYKSLPRSWQAQTVMSEVNPRPSIFPPEQKSSLGKQTYKSVYTSNTTWNWKR